MNTSVNAVGDAIPVEIPFGMTPEDAKMAELSHLPLIEYEKCREVEAKAMGVRVAILDKLVKAARPKEQENETANPFADVNPWPSDVHGAALADMALVSLDQEDVHRAAEAALFRTRWPS